MGIFSGNKPTNHIEITNLNKTYAKYVKKISDDELIPNTTKEEMAYVLDFEGSVMANEVESFRREVTTLLLVAKKDDKVIINIYSPGGSVDGYGLVAEQVDRIKRKGIHVTTVVDRVAASGGYMVACVGDKVVASKRAVIGSIGVVVGMPDYTDIMSKVGVGFKFYTAGKYKRLVTPLVKPTEKDEEKLKEDLAVYHDMFKNHVSEYRKNVDIEKISTGEVWMGEEAIAMGLVDEIGISDDIIMDLVMSGYSTRQITYVVEKKKTFLQRMFGASIDSVVNRIVKRIEEHIQSFMIGRR